MKNTEQAKAHFTGGYNTPGTAKPAAPFVARQLSSDRRHLDPSSVMRSDRCPVPVSFEHRNPESAQ